MTYHHGRQHEVSLAMTGGCAAWVSICRRPFARWLFLGLLISGGTVAWGDAGADTSRDVLPVLTLKRLSIEELLDQPVISVSRKPESWGEAASNVFLIRAQSVVATGAVDLPDLLRLAPNLFVARVSASTSGITARGFLRAGGASNKLLVMIDGRSVYSPLFSNVFWDATTTFLPDLQQIEVISGPAGSAWGSNAVNGVINIQTKSARETLGGLAFVHAGAQRTDVGGRFGARLGDRGAVRVYLERVEGAGSFSGAGVDDAADKWTLTTGGFRADWRAGDASNLTLSGDTVSGRFHNAGAADTVADGANLLGRWERDLTPDSSLWLRWYYDYAKRESRGLITETTRTADLEFQHRLVLANEQEVLWGGNYRYIADQIADTAGFAVRPARLDFALGSLFAQHEIDFAGRQLRLTSGLRVERNHFSGVEYQPTLRLALVRPRATWWLALSRATRIPSRLETGLFTPATPPYQLVSGNGIRAETVQVYELGWRRQPTPNFSFTSTVFYNEYDHLLSIEPTQPATIANGVAGRSYGLEVFADWQATGWWRMRVGGFLATQETWVKPGGGDLNQASGQNSYPKYQVQLRNVFTLRKDLSLWTSLRHVAEVPTFENGISGVVPAYTELDLALLWTLNPRLELSLGGQNLLDSSHPELGSPATRREIPRSYYGAAHWRF